MKSILVCMFAFVVGLALVGSTKPAEAYELKNVMISSVKAAEVGKGTHKQKGLIVYGTAGNDKVEFFVGAKTKFFKMVNGKRQPVTHAAGVGQLKAGTKINLTAKKFEKGIIAVLIGLLIPA